MAHPVMVFSATGVSNTRFFRSEELVHTVIHKVVAGMDHHRPHTCQGRPDGTPGHGILSNRRVKHPFLAKFLIRLKGSAKNPFGVIHPKTHEEYPLVPRQRLDMGFTNGLPVFYFSLFWLFVLAHTSKRPLTVRPRRETGFLLQI